MYIKLDASDAQNLATQAMIGILVSQHVLRQAIDASGRHDKEARLQVVDSLVANGQKLIKMTRSTVSPESAAIMRDLVLKSPALIDVLNVYAASIGHTGRKTALLENVRNSISSIRTSVERARSVINHVDGKPFEMPAEQMQVLYRVPAGQEPHIDPEEEPQEEMTMR